MARGGARVGAGRKPKDPAIKAAAENAVKLARVSKYDPALCAEVERVMGEGFSLGAFAGKVGIARATVNQWMFDYPDFAEAVSRGKCARLVHWEEAAMRVAKTGGGPGTATMIVFGLKNMGGDDWSDKQEVSHTGAFAHAHTAIGPEVFEQIARKVINDF